MDFKGTNPVNQENPVVVSIIIANFMVSKVLINQGSSINILYWKTLQRLEVSLDTFHPHAGPLLGFAGKRLEIIDYMDLMTTFDQGKLSKSFTIRYLLVDAYTSYFALISRPKASRQCYVESLKVAPYPPTKEPTKLHPIAAEGTQVMSVDEGSQIRALTIYQASLGDEFDIDLRDETSDKGPKPVENLVAKGSS
ncbi:hypothetical protein AAZX31_18G131100 [Glycine max]